MQKLLNKNYDHQLLEIEHYQKHPQLLPFIGINYDISRILLIGESHYVENEKLPADILANWYQKTTDELFAACNNEQKKYIDWFDTRKVINKFICRYRSRAYSTFTNPAKILQELIPSCPTDSAAFQSVAFMNYYQIPSSKYGNSINCTEVDSVKAKEVLIAVIAKIAPQIIIFCSKKAYNDLGLTTIQAADQKIDIFGIAHPTSPHWHKSGKMDFRSILANYPLLKNINPPLDERLELIKQLFEDFYQAFDDYNVINPQNKIQYQKCDPKLIDDYYHNHQIDPYIDCGPFKIAICHKLYIEGDNDWQYLPKGGNKKADRANSPDFKTGGELFAKLFDNEYRIEFIRESIVFIKAHL